MNLLDRPNTKEDILKKVCNQAVLGHHWLPLKEKKYYGSQWCPRISLFPSFFRILPLCSAEQRHSYRFGNYLRVSKWQKFHFWVNYSFKICLYTWNHIWCYVVSLFTCFMIFISFFNWKDRFYWCNNFSITVLIYWHHIGCRRLLDAFFSFIVSVNIGYLCMPISSIVTCRLPLSSHSYLFFESHLIF